MKLIHLFMSITKKKIQVDENGRKYILLRTDVYFFEYLLAVEIDEKVHTDRNLIFEEKRQEALEKPLGYIFIKIKGYDKDYEIDRTRKFSGKFKNSQLRKLQKESNKGIKELEDEIKKFKILIDKSNYPIKAKRLK